MNSLVVKFKNDSREFVLTGDFAQVFINLDKLKNQSLVAKSHILKYVNEEDLFGSDAMYFSRLVNGKTFFRLKDVKKTFN